MSTSTERRFFIKNLADRFPFPKNLTTPPTHHLYFFV